MKLHAARVKELYYGNSAQAGNENENFNGRVEILQQEKLMVCCLLRCHQFLLSLLVPPIYLRPETEILSRITDSFVDRVAQLLVTGICACSTMISSTFNIAAHSSTEAARLHEREDWIATESHQATTAVESANRGSIRATSLPKEFRDLVLAALKLLQGTGLPADPSHVRIRRGRVCVLHLLC